MTTQQLQALRRKVQQGGGEEKHEVRRRDGILGARERLNALLDEGTFAESGALAGGEREPAQGVVCGYGAVQGRPVCVYAQDFTVLGGSVGQAHAEKICRAMDAALINGVPLVALLDSAGARLHEGLAAVAAYARVYRKAVDLRGQVPMIGVVAGPCIGAAAWAAGLMDFVFMTGSRPLLQTWGPQVMQAAGATPPDPLASGVVQFHVDDERQCLLAVRELLGYLPPNCLEDAPLWQEEAPDDGAAQALEVLSPGLYDMAMVLSAVADGVFATSAAFAPNLITAFGRIGGRTVGIVANQPRSLEGAIDGAACIKAARFVRFCNDFRVPVVTFVDTAGVVLDAREEADGLVSRCCELLEAYAHATVPKITVLCGHANGSAMALLGCRELGMDAVYAWPQAQLSVLPAETAANILFAREIAAAEDPAAARVAAVARWQLDESNPLHAAELGLLDDIIAPQDTRATVGTALDLLLGKRERRARGRLGREL